MLFLHLSDIHFKTKDVNRVTDPNLGLRDDLIDDVRKMRAKIGRPVDAILISGDIAFAGQEYEYDFALRWLRDKLCPVSGCEFENIIVIPGNHDVDRDAARTPIDRSARAQLRSTPIVQSNAEITAFMNDRKSSEMLFSPIDNYNRFASNFLCGIGYEDAAIWREPYVLRQFPLNDQSTLNVWGFNSVLVCDALDKKELMFVDPSAAQVIERDAGTAHMVMCHHPFNWLRNGAEFRDRIEQVAKIHLFGHEHDSRVEQSLRFTRIKAGALQPERDEPGWQPGYNLIDVSVTGVDGHRKLAVKVWARQRNQARFIAVPDFDDNETWDSFHDLPYWTAPAPPVSIPTATEVIFPMVGRGEETVMQLPTIRSVAPKLLGLSEKDQDNIIKSLGLSEDSDSALRDYEAALAAVRRAADRGVLADLDFAIQKFIASRGD